MDGEVLKTVGQVPGSIIGQVTGLANAPVPNAQVSAKNAAGVAQPPVQTDVRGNYKIADLAAGTYTVTVEAPQGLQTPASVQVQVIAGQEATQNFPLQAGAQTGAFVRVGENQQDVANQLASRRRTATDAEMLIEHASRGGVQIEDAITQRILQWIQQVRSGESIKIEDEVAFWRAYQGINAAVLPANVDSIRERLDFNDAAKRSHLEHASDRSRAALICILIFTLLVHCYFAVLQSLISDAQTAATNFANAKISLATAATPLPLQVREEAVEKLRAASCIWHSNLELLGYWLFVDDIARFFDRAVSSNGSVAAPPGESTVPREESGACKLEILASNNQQALLTAPLETTDKLADDAALLTRAVSLRNAISQFVLPLLYGWLGALAYGLRKFASELRTVTFSRATHIEQKMRIPLGILAGATVGLLIQPETLNTIQGVTSIGIAFGLGFSVDLFFDLLEGLMARLKGTPVTEAASPIVVSAPALATTTTSAIRAGSG